MFKSKHGHNDNFYIYRRKDFRTVSLYFYFGELFVSDNK